LWIPVFVALAAALLWLFRPLPVAVDLAAVSRGALQVTVGDEGETRVRDMFVISAPVSGLMRRIELEAGDQVRAGDTVIARIEPTDPSFLDPRSKAEARAAVRAGEAALAHASAELKRAEASINVEIDLSDDQKADLMAFIRDDGKGFVATHSGATAFFSWPEFGEMLGGRFDEHPWGITDATVVLEDSRFPATRHFPARVTLNDEFYQVKDFSRDKVRVLAHIDPASVDMNKPLVHRTDADFAVAWAKTHGKGRVFYSILGHAAESWDNPLINQMYFHALRWAMRLEDADLTPLRRR
jgi:type 1 glutamine amidotransferase